MRSFLGSVAESLGISKKKHSAQPVARPKWCPLRIAKHLTSQVSSATMRFRATRCRRDSWRNSRNSVSSRSRVSARRLPPDGLPRLRPLLRLPQP